MGKSYSLALRERVIDFLGAGGSRRQAASHFGVSPSFAVKLWRCREETGSPAPAKQGRPAGGGKLANCRESQRANPSRQTIGGFEIEARYNARRAV
jgi:transposase